MAEKEKKQEMTMEAMLAKFAELEAKLEAAEKASAEVTQAKESELSSGQKQALLERNLQKAMLEAKKETVMLTLPMLPGADDDDTAVCGVNGLLWQVKRGEPVEVPKCVAEVFAIADKQKMAAIQYKKGLQKKKKKKDEE